MRTKNIIPVLLMAMQLPAAAQHYADPNAQSLRMEESQRQTNEGHYYGSESNMAVGMNLPTEETSPLSLINAYHLNTPGTLNRITLWNRQYPVHPMATRMQLLQANLQVREGHYAEALDIYQKVNVETVPANERADAQLHEAIAYIKMGDLARAKNLLARIEYTDEHEMDVQYYSGYVRYAEGNYAEALPFLQVAENCDGYRDQASVYIADCMLQTGRLQDALARIRRGPIATDLAADACRVEGEALHDMGDYNSAITALEKYTSMTASPNRTALYKLGNSYFQAKAYGKAADAFSRSAGTAQDELAQNAWLHAGIGYVNMGSKQQARMAFQQASQMSFDPKVQEEALYNYALTLHDGATMGFGESVNVFEQFLNQFPQSRYKDSVSQHLTEVYFTTKNYPAALASINKIQKPNAEILAAKQKVLYNLGVQSFTKGDFNSAKDFMAQSLQITSGQSKTQNSTASEAYYWKGEAEYRLGEYAQATNDLQQYLKQPKLNTRNHAMASYALGYTRFKQKNYKEALPSFQRFVTEAEETVFAGDDKKLKSLKADAYNRIGDCQFSARNYDAAYAAYQSAHENDRVNGDYALLQQALISGLRGDYKKKVELLGQLTGEYRDSEYGADALFEQGRAYVQSGDRTNALKTFTTLIEQYPQNTLSHRAENEIGMIYAENGQTGAAIKAYKDVLTKYPNTGEAQTALSNLKDIYTEQGKVNEYATLAQLAGKALSPTELDEMTQSAAFRAMSAGNHTQALQYYQQLEAQTQSVSTRLEALTGQLHAAQAAKDNATIISVATRLLQGGLKASPDVAAEARLLRAQSYMAQNNTDAAMNDLQVLSQDTRTVYGAQATVELAQYAYNTRQYQTAETLLMNFINSGTVHSYWLARAFVLLADVYSQTDRTIEARQYLLSLKSNYTESEEINRMIDERLQKLK